MGRHPATGFTLPSSASSPQKIIFAALSAFTIPRAASIPTAIGRSKPAPSFFMAAGARFTVIRSKGKGYPEFWIAALTLSLLSLTMLSGSPTVAKPGKARSQVHLYFHQDGVDAEKRACVGFGDHGVLSERMNSPFVSPKVFSVMICECLRVYRPDPIYSEKCLGPVQPLWGWASVRDGKGQEIRSQMDLLSL